MEFKAKRRTLSLIIDGVSHEVRFPKTKEQYELEGKLKAAGDGGAADVLFDFLGALGLAREAAMDLEAEDLLEIVKIITGQKKS
jgi:hypothetical protein